MSKQLDDSKLVARLDPGQALKSVAMLGAQIKQTWQDFKKVKIPKSFRQIEKILINGMGGSALGAHLIQSVYSDELTKPFQIINSYNLPAYLDHQTLYLISSYSGNTEEPISTVTKARQRGAKIFGLTAGGRLASLIRQHKMPGFIFEPKANPSAQPRLGLGYSLTAQLALLKRLGLIKLSDQRLNTRLRQLEMLRQKFDFSTPTANNPAKKMAQALSGRNLIFVAAEHLAGNAHIFANQTNETAKTFAAYYLIPELDHHLLDGLKVSTANKTSLTFVFLDSKLYHPKNQLRQRITSQIVSQNKIRVLSYQLKSSDRLGQALEAVFLSSYVTFYLALLNNSNPNVIPWVDYLKAELKRHS